MFQPKQVEVISKPIEIDIIQPTMPRHIDLSEPKWFVVSEAKADNPCVKEAYEPKQFDDDGKEKFKRPKMDHPEGLLKENGKPVRVCKLGKENPDWPDDYTKLDLFLDEMKKMNSGDVVFVAMTISDYELMSKNMQELRRYIREVQEVVVYYRTVTINKEPAVGAEITKK